MTEAAFLRARSPEQKRRRREDILAAAAAVLAREGVEGVSLGAVAEEAGVVKSGLYRYFESREEMLARLLLRDLDEAVAELEEGLAPLAGTGDLAAAARLIARAFAARPRLCALTSALAVVLESNIGEAALVSIKAEMTRAAERLVVAGVAVRPGMGPEKWGQAVRLIFALAAGLWPLANPAPHVAQVLDRPEFAALHKDFAEDMEDAARALLTGLAAEEG